MLGGLVGDLRPLLHPMVVHFPIALLCAGVALDWAGYWLRLANLTRGGFYLLTLGAAGAGVAALVGPDHAAGGAAVASLLTLHQTFALVTVALAVALTAVRFFAADGIAGRGALLYLACTLALLATLSLTGYYGGELTYHQGVGVVTARGTLASGDAVTGGQVPVKPFVALLGLLCLAALGLWLGAGRRLVGPYYAIWERALRDERAGTNGALWTLRRAGAAADAGVAALIEGRGARAARYDGATRPAEGVAPRHRT
jgi:uncharacterized membrane protein